VPQPGSSFSYQYAVPQGTVGTYIPTNSALGTWIHFQGGYRTSDKWCGILFQPTFNDYGTGAGSYIRALPVSNSICNLQFGYMVTRENGDHLYYDTMAVDIENGSVSYRGATHTSNVVIELDADDDTQYEDVYEDFDQTDEDTGEFIQTNTLRTRTEYKGRKLDVRERILNFQARLDAMESNEIIDDATDSALLSLIANLSTRLDQKDSLIANLQARLEVLENNNT